MSFTTVVRAATATRTITRNRAFHSPFSVLGDSSPKENTISSAYEKHYDHPSEPVYHSGLRTYVVSEPDAHSRHYQVPAGAYPTSAPFLNFTPTSAPDSDLHADNNTKSAAVRKASAPGVTEVRGGGLDNQGTARNGSAAEKFSKAGVNEVWELTK